MFKMICTDGPFSDCTSRYDIDLESEYSVDSFVKTVLEQKVEEWGCFDIALMDEPFAYCRYEYKYGMLLCSIPDALINKKIVEAYASGGWSNMDYLLFVK